MSFLESVLPDFSSAAGEAASASTSGVGQPAASVSILKWHLILLEGCHMQETPAACQKSSGRRRVFMLAPMSPHGKAALLLM